MATYTTNRTNAAQWSAKLHDSLARHGWQPEDIKLFSGGTHGDDWIQAQSDILTEANLQSLLDNANILTINTTKTTITADDVDEAVITCVELATFNVNISKNGILEQTGVAIPDGSLELSSGEAATYLIEIYTDGSFATGYIEIEAI